MTKRAKKPPTRPSRRTARKLEQTQFGAVLAFLLLLLFAIWGIGGHWMITAAMVVLLVSVVAPQTLSPARFLWMKLGDALGKIVAALLMGAVFFFVVSPLALLKRIISGKAMPTTFDRAQESYFIEREKPKVDADDMRFQF